MKTLREATAIGKKHKLTSRTRMIQSLMQSVVTAGGSASSFSIPRLKHMSAMELIEYLAPNNIRFVHTEIRRINKEACMGTTQGIKHPDIALDRQEL